MKELTDKFRPYIKLLVLPYLLIMFILVFPINYYILNPGGIVEVQKLINVDYNQDKEVTGSISSTYVADINRPTFFQFMIGYFSPYSSIGALSGSNLTYSNSEITQVSYLDKAESVNAAILIAYEKAAITNPNDVKVTYDEKELVYGKAQYLSNYDEINFGDEFVSMMGDNGIIMSMDQIGANSVKSDQYDFTFKREDGTTYTVTLEKHIMKDDAGNIIYDNEGNPVKRFGLTLKLYYIIDKDETFPTYTEGATNIGGPSGGLMQTLAIYNMLVPEDITHGLKIAGTGTINYDGSVGYIGGVKQKIATAYLNHVDVFFIPYLNQDPNSNYYDNYIEALRACKDLGIDPTGWLQPVSSFQDALDYLNGLDN